MSTTDCGGYHRGQGAYVFSNCSEESSTFFIILGFTMLVLVLLLFIVVVIACVRRQRIRARAALHHAQMGAEEMEDDCVIYVDGNGQELDSQAGRNMDAVKCVIMAGEEKPTFIAHPVVDRLPPPSSELPAVEGGEHGGPNLPEEDEASKHDGVSVK